MERIQIINVCSAVLFILNASGCDLLQDSDYAKQLDFQTYAYGSESAPWHSCPGAVATEHNSDISNFGNCVADKTPGNDASCNWYSMNNSKGGEVTATLQGETALFRSSNCKGRGCVIGYHLAHFQENAGNCSYDATPYAGIRFEARGKGRIEVKIATVSNIAVEKGGTCLRKEDCEDTPAAYARLSDKWETFEIPFCAMFPEGWGKDVAPVDPAEIVDIQFYFSEGQAINFWLKSISFFTEEAVKTPISCTPACPMDVVPHPEMVIPETASIPLSAQLTLHNFDQVTPRCGAIQRRYLQFVPAGTASASNAPIVIALHGSEGNAESFQQFLAHGRFDELAARDGFIIVYGSAAPGLFSSFHDNWPNANTWRSTYNDDGQVDDVAYLEMVLDDMKSRGVITGDNDVYLVGLSNGGGMVFTAMSKRPDMFKGVAAFMPFVGFEPFIVPDLTGTGLDRILIGMSTNDPELPKGYDDILAPLPTACAVALGLPENAIAHLVETPLPNVISEGANYNSDNPVALRTRNSTATQLDMAAADLPGRVRILKFENAGHLWPTPIPDTDDGINEDLGFRNQDIDAADATWEFFTTLE